MTDDGSRTAPRLFGLTGGIGSGKSAVAEMLRRRGIPVFDADEAARDLTGDDGEAIPEIVAAFGPAVVLPDGRLDRGTLARRVFTDPESRRRLEAILHPRVDAVAADWLAARRDEGHRVCFYSAPLLFEADRDAGMEAVIAVLADEDLRVARVVARDGATPAGVRARIAAQVGDSERVVRADHVLDNNGTLDDLRARLDALLGRILGDDTNP